MLNPVGLATQRSVSLEFRLYFSSVSRQLHDNSTAHSQNHATGINTPTAQTTKIIEN